MKMNMKSYMHQNPREQSPGPRCPRALSRAAFTLVELLVVIAIIALLAAILTPMVQRAVSQSRRSQAHTEVNALAMALQSYFAVYNSWDDLPADGEFEGSVIQELAGGNRRGQVFMEFPQEAWDDPPFLAPELEPGETRQPYRFAVDRNHSNTVETGTPDDPVRRRVAVWVEDPDGGYITSWGRRNDNQ